MGNYWTTMVLGGSKISPLNAYGPDTGKLLRRIKMSKDGYLDVSELNITSLPTLPSGLHYLVCENTPLTSLPKLPRSLRGLYCNNTPLTSLPELPSTLKRLFCNNTLLTTLPELPDLEALSCDNTRIALQREEEESIRDYILRLRVWIEELAMKKRNQERCFAVKEELMAAAWHPNRIERWLDAGVELEAL